MNPMAYPTSRAPTAAWPPPSRLAEQLSLSFGLGIGSLITAWTPATAQTDQAAVTDALHHRS